MSYPLRTAAAVTALGLAGAAVWTFSSGGSDPAAQQKPVTLGRIATVALTTHHDCADLLAYYKKQALRTVGAYGLDSVRPLFDMAERADAAGKVAAPNAIGSSQSAPDTSTNVQVAGVDEADVLKTSGDLMVAVVNGEVRIARLAGAQTKKLSSWHPGEGAAASVLLDGTTAVVIGDQNGGIPLGAMKMPAGANTYSANVELTVLDLTDPAHPRPVRRLVLDGSRSGEARLSDGEIRLALTSGPHGITWKAPVYPNDVQDAAKAQAKFRLAEKKATAANKRLIANSTIADWVPQATVTELNAAGAPTGPAVHRPLLDCAQLAVPNSYSGLSTLALAS